MNSITITINENDMNDTTLLVSEGKDNERKPVQVPSVG